MVDLAIQKRLASEILKVGKSRVWIDPDKVEDVAPAITREDIRGLIDEGVIRSKPEKGISRGRYRERQAKRAYGHRRGHGSRKGTKGARRGKKSIWVKKIRILRRRLMALKDEGVLTTQMHRKLYMKAKGGEFKNLAHLNAYLDTIGIKTTAEQVKKKGKKEPKVSAKKETRKKETKETKVKAPKEKKAKDAKETKVKTAKEPKAKGAKK
jgi:large subunit ribosomal protein L19e